MPTYASLCTLPIGITADTRESLATSPWPRPAGEAPSHLPALQLLWTYAKKSVALRVRYFTTLPKGVASHTALVQDIPGIPFGTQVQRAESLAPGFIAKKARNNPDLRRLSVLYQPLTIPPAE